MLAEIYMLRLEAEARAAAQHNSKSDTVSFLPPSSLGARAWLRGGFAFLLGATLAGVAHLYI